jgi:hypothetical protein
MSVLDLMYRSGKRWSWRAVVTAVCLAAAGVHAVTIDFQDVTTAPPNPYTNGPYRFMQVSWGNLSTFVRDTFGSDVLLGSTWNATILVQKTNEHQYAGGAFNISTVQVYCVERAGSNLVITGCFDVGGSVTNVLTGLTPGLVTNVTLNWSNLWYVTFSEIDTAQNPRFALNNLVLADGLNAKPPALSFDNLPVGAISNPCVDPASGLQVRAYNDTIGSAPVHVSVVQGPWFIPPPSPMLMPGTTNAGDYEGNNADFYISMTNGAAFDLYQLDVVKWFGGYSNFFFYGYRTNGVLTDTVEVEGDDVAHGAVPHTIVLDWHSVTNVRIIHYQTGDPVSSGNPVMAIDNVFVSKPLVPPVVRTGAVLIIR